MKKSILILLIISYSLLYSQEKSSNDFIKKENDLPTYIVIDGEKYRVSKQAMAKMEIGWVLTASIPSEEGRKNGEPVILYANNFYKENIYAAIGLREDNNIYTSLDSYANFEYKNGSTLEESIELYFKENYIISEKDKKKKYWWKIYIYAIVEKDGSLSEITVNKGVNKRIDSSVIEIVKHMPAWIPATKGGENVRSKCFFGVYFEWFNQK